jgi:hypothetical protein
MKTKLIQIHQWLYYALCLLVTGVGMNPSTALAQQEPCGPISINIPAGTTAVTLPGRNPCLFSLTPVAMSGTTITFAAGSFVAGAYNSHVLEISGGPGKGHCSLVVSNTTSAISTADDLSGFITVGSSVICVRKQVTLSQISGFVAFEDQVILKTPGPVGVVQTSYLFDGQGWVNAVDGSPSNPVLDPCEPFCVVAAETRVLTMDLCRPDYSCCEVVAEDCCIDFSPGHALEWKSQGTLGLDQNGGYLAAQVLPPPGGRFRVSGPAPCAGNWAERLTAEKCLQLCWDVRMFSDGNDFATIPYPATIQLCSGTLCATFTVTAPITENGGPNSGWYRFCAPIQLAPAAGPLPSNATGAWSGVTPAQWNTLLTNVTTIAFASDPLKPLPNSKWGWDNICLEEADCDCFRFVETGWTCTPVAGGGYTWTLTGTVTNLSPYTANKIFVRPISPVGLTVSPSQINVNLAPGASQSISVTFGGVTANSKVCFRLVLFNLEKGECCKEDICVEIPCVKLTPTVGNCTPTGVQVSFAITNTTALPIAGIYLIGQAPAVISPAYYPLGPLAVGASTTITGVTISGLPAGGVANFQAIIVNAGGENCCEQTGKVTLPPCPQDPVATVPPFPVAPRAEPCPPVQGSAAVPPLPTNACALICCEKVLCDPARPNVWTYSFVVQNTGTQPMSQLLFPSPQVSPGGVSFVPPLLPGQAASVTLTITGVPLGLFNLPMLAFNNQTGECCSWRQPVQLNCGCAQVVNSTTVCAGSQNGLICINTTLTVQNLSGGVVDVIYLTAVNPPSAIFVPDSFNIPPLAPNATTTLTTQIKVPFGTTVLTYYLTLHDANFDHCCASAVLTLKLPSCCDCVGDFVFEGQGPLPPGVNMVNVERDTLGKIGFGAQTNSWPFVCMACSGRGTIVRFDDNTGTVLGEYWTAPQTLGGGSSPSRTTVDRYGECWVGNRTDDAYDPISNTYRGSVTRIGLVIGGTRGRLLPGPVFVPDPTGEYLQGPFTYQSPSVWDRNGDGFIRTSRGLGFVLNWDNALTNGNQQGMPLAGLYLADDELITNYVRVAGNGVRGMAIDANNDLWTGGYNNFAFQKVSGLNGSLLGPVITSLGRSYGALVDANNMLWTVERNTSLSLQGIYRYDVTANNVPGTNSFITDPGIYGIGVDRCSGEVWTSSVYSSDDLETDPGDITNTSDIKAWLRRFSPAGNLTRERAQTWPLDPNYSTSAQGLCVDRNGVVWVSAALYTRSGLQKYDPTADVWTSPGLPAVTVPFSSSPYPGSTGCAEDHLGRIWVSDNGDHAGHRFNPTSSTFDLSVDLNAGAAPYNYSDMTGAVALNAGGQVGLLTAVHDSLCPGTDWGRVTWNAIGITPACSIKAEVRASDNPLSFPNGWTSVSSGANFCGKGIKGRYVEIRITFYRPGGANCIPTCNPKLCWLKIECCEAIGAVPVVTLPSDVATAPGLITVFPGEVAIQVPRMGSASATATWNVDGTNSAPFAISGTDSTASGWVVMNVTFTGNLAPGAHLVSLSVETTQGSSSAQTIVTVADQAPQISALPSLSQTAFQGIVPDYRPLAVVSDDVTPASSLIVTQLPPPGSIVTQGQVPVRLTVRDESGQSSSAQTLFNVLPVLRLTAPANYTMIPSGQPIMVNASVAVPLASIASYRVEFIGAQGSRITTVTSLPAEIPALPPGEYSLQITALNSEGKSSTSPSISLLILRPLTAPAPTLLATAGGGNNMLLQFPAPNGARCCVQKSTDLINWVDFEIITGAGLEVDVPVTRSPDEPAAFYRVLIQHPE